MIVIAENGPGFCNASPAICDSFRAGNRIDGAGLEPFCVRVKDECGRGRMPRRLHVSITATTRAPLHGSPAFGSDKKGRAEFAFEAVDLRDERGLADAELVGFHTEVGEAAGPGETAQPFPTPDVGDPATPRGRSSSRLRVPDRGHVVAGMLGGAEPSPLAPAVASLLDSLSGPSASDARFVVGFSVFGEYRDQVRITPTPIPANPAIVASVSPRSCMRAIAALPCARAAARLRAASVRTWSPTAARRSVSQASASPTLPTATVQVAMSSTFARSRCARSALAFDCASRARRRASSLMLAVLSAMPGNINPRSANRRPCVPH